MKRVAHLLCGCLAALLLACQPESSFYNDSLRITTDFSRSLQDGTFLTAGESALFHASGGLVLDGECLTFNGSAWVGASPLSWSDPEQGTTVAALYPVYDDRSYSSDNLYADGELEDVLLARVSLVAKAPIELVFRHVFSRLVFTLDEGLQERVAEVELVTPVRVASLDLSDDLSTVCMEWVEEPCSTVRSLEADGSCSFILPPAEACVLTLRLVFRDGTVHEQLLPAHTFVGGCMHSCHLYSAAVTRGIRTAEDLIAFSRLYNGMDGATDRELADFGQMENGKWVFRLLEDICLTEEESARLWPIGYYSGRPFQDVFEGDGHVVADLVLADWSGTEKTAGLFGYIGDEGRVRGIQLEGVSQTGTTTSRYVGGIAGKCEGSIEDCSVSYSSLSAAAAGYVAPVCARLIGGAVVNCSSVSNTTAVPAEGCTGGLVADATGYLLNCYTHSNTFTGLKSGTTSGGLVGIYSSSAPLYLENCLVYHPQSLKEYWGAAIGNCQADEEDYVEIVSFYANRRPLVAEGAVSQTANAAVYNNASFTVSGIHVSEKLNDGRAAIPSPAGSAYVYREWTVAEDGSACFK